MSTEKDKFQSEDTLSANTRYNDLIRRVWPYISKYKFLLILVTTLVCIHTTIGRILPNIIGYAVDHVIIAKRLDMLLKVCLVYLSLEITRFIFVIIETYYFQVLGQKVIYDLRSDLYSHIQKLEIAYFDKNPVGRVVTRVTNDFSALADLFTAGLVSVFTDSLSLFAIVIAMSLISVKLTLVVMAITPLMLWGSVWLSKMARDTLRVIKKNLASVNAFVAENINGMKVIQLYVRENSHIARFTEASRAYFDAYIRNLKYLAWLNPVLNGFNAITVAAALYYGGVFKEDSAIQVGALIAFLSHVQDFLPPLRNILEKYQTFQASLASAERIFTLFDASEENLSGTPLPEARVMGNIEFENVNFAYDPRIAQVLKNVSFKIQPGQSVAIVGATGSGKSTIVSLLQRFYELDKDPKVAGKILLDGMDIRTLQKQDLRKRIGVVQQDFFLFKGTVQSNISLNDPLIGADRVRSAALKAHCEDILRSHPGGLEATVQERGTNLSTGEKQLISFARVLAFNPDILILDEATAHIDSHSEALIQEATKEVTKGRTSIIIAHRLSTILECDWILVLDNGQLIEQGRHQDLLEARGAYHNLYTLQLSKQIQH
jgi:ATP-binding cassette, subfamily B, multidrug efflux pump